MNDLPRRAAAEALGTGLLVATVVGSGIMADQLAGGNVALALLANALATGAVLVALVLSLAPVSGAHLNPAVTLAEALTGAIAAPAAAAYVVAQLAGGLAGTVLAHAMFEEPLLGVSTHARTGGGLWISEVVATFGLVAVIHACARKRPDAVPWAVASWIVAAYWFTASTSFANPAVTVARAFTDTFAGIRPVDVPGFVLAQLAGASAAAAVMGWLVPVAAPDAKPSAPRTAP